MPKVKITVVKGFSAEEVFGDDVPVYYPKKFKSPCYGARRQWSSSWNGSIKQ
jgi:hypothetical protein